MNDQQVTKTVDVLQMQWGIKGGKITPFEYDAKVTAATFIDIPTRLILAAAIDMIPQSKSGIIDRKIPAQELSHRDSWGWIKPGGIVTLYGIEFLLEVEADTPVYVRLDEHGIQQEIFRLQMYLNQIGGLIAESLP